MVQMKLSELFELRDFENTRRLVEASNKNITILGVNFIYEKKILLGRHTLHAFGCIKEINK